MPVLTTSSATLADLNRSHGTVWVSQTIAQPIQSLTLQAYHGVTVLLNGHRLLHNTNLVVPPGTLAEGEPPVTIEVNQTPQQLAALPNQTNHLMVMVESFGDHKGFYQDDRLPSGLVSLTINGSDQNALENARWSTGMQEDDGITDVVAWFTGQATGQSTDHPPMFWHASTRVELTVPDSLQTSYGLVFDHGQFERIYMLLNGVVIGRYWSESQAQRIFYLPEGILNHQGVNHISLVLIPGELVPKTPESVAKLLGTIRLVPVVQYERRPFSLDQLL
jgi:hypothetical protein